MSFDLVINMNPQAGEGSSQPHSQLRHWMLQRREQSFLDQAVSLLQSPERRAAIRCPIAEWPPAPGVYSEEVSQVTGRRSRRIFEFLGHVGVRCLCADGHNHYAWQADRPAGPCRVSHLGMTSLPGTRCPSTAPFHRIHAPSHRSGHEGPARMTVSVPC